MPKGVAAGERSMDDASRTMLFEGLNKSQIAQAFKVDAKTLDEKLYGVPPDGVRNGSKVWRIHRIVPYLARLTPEVIEERMRNMSHHDLPKIFTKEYWAGQRSRQEYELRAGDLWPTAKVVEKVGELYKLVRMSTMLMLDAVEKTTELSERQRQIIKDQAEGMLEDLHKRVTQHFAAKEEENERQEAQDDEDV